MKHCKTKQHYEHFCLCVHWQRFFSVGWLTFISIRVTWARSLSDSSVRVLFCLLWLFSQMDASSMLMILVDFPFGWKPGSVLHLQLGVYCSHGTGWASLVSCLYLVDEGYTAPRSFADELCCGEIADQFRWWLDKRLATSRSTTAFCQFFLYFAGWIRTTSPLSEGPLHSGCSTLLAPVVCCDVAALLVCWSLASTAAWL